MAAADHGSGAPTRFYEDVELDQPREFGEYLLTSDEVVSFAPLGPEDRPAVEAFYAEDFERLAAVCRERGVALQTIKSVARKRWPADYEGRRYSWYQAVEDPEALERAVHWVLAHDDVFLNSSSDGRLLEPTLQAAERFEDVRVGPDDGAMRADIAEMGIEPLFVRGVSDVI